MYKGVTIEFPIGAGGYNGSENPRNIPVGDLIKANNVVIRQGVLEKAPGLFRFEAGGTIDDGEATPAPSKLLGGHDWHPTTAIQKQISVWDNGDIYKEAAGNIDAVTLASSINVTNPVVFVECGQPAPTDSRILLMFSEGVAPRKLVADGATMSVLGSTPGTDIPVEWTGTTQPAGSVFHDFRVYAWLGHTIYTSELTDHTSFWDDSVLVQPPIFDVQPGIGTKISAIVPDTQTGGTKIIVFKYPLGIFIIDTLNVVSSYIPVTTLSTDVGCAGPHAAAVVENDVFFIGANGHLYSLQATMTNKNVAQADITQALNMSRWILSHVSLKEADLKFAKLLYNNENKELLVTMRSKNSPTMNDIIYRVDLSEIQRPKITHDTRDDYYNACWFQRGTNGEKVLLTGGDDGMIYRSVETSNVITDADDEQIIYSGVIELPETNFSYAGQELNNRIIKYDWLELDFIRKSNTQLAVGFRVDTKTVNTQTFQLSAEGSQLDQGQLDSFILGGGTAVETRKIRVGAIGRKLSIMVSHNFSGGFKLEEMTYLIHEVVSSGREIIGFDLCEVANGSTDWDANVGARALWQLVIATERSRRQKLGVA
jgi:hypothetical protein